ncbi:MAG: ribonuclease HII [Bacillota bacterium]|nr:ribonuclease HII [Bacillota bacterium]
MNAAQRKEEKARKELEQWQHMCLYEEELRKAGKRLIAGVDEAGRGPLAGPVIAAAVILPEEAYLPGLNDSKKLSEKRRLELEQQIKRTALSWACSSANHLLIDRINILNASKLAMERALKKLKKQPDFVLIDGNMQLKLSLPQKTIIKGDSLSVSIAAASILAKCARDRLMLQLDSRYPQYYFAKHKGYPTALHKECLQNYGPSPVHRLSFKY